MEVRDTCMGMRMGLHGNENGLAWTGMGLHGWEWACMDVNGVAWMRV